eukprot:XP_022261880.1 ly6/PLAUR domain-containing protein 6B isoform X1 [Canis lupus familiaris]
MLPLRHALAVAVVHIFILSESWALAKNINFYNVRPPLDPTPFPNSFKCFTCENAGDNYNCNRWAEDKWCPQSRSQLPLRGVLRRRGVRCSALRGRGVLRGRAQAPENCPDTRYCLTVHHFTSHGRSTSITKKCASRSECHSVGCHHSRDSEHTVRSVCVCVCVCVCKVTVLRLVTHYGKAGRMSGVVYMFICPLGKDCASDAMETTEKLKTFCPSTENNTTKDEW